MVSRGKECESGQEENRSRILFLDPAVLSRDNLAVGVVNEESYRRMDGKRFDPLQFQPILVVRVKVETDEGESTRFFIKDGHTRAKYAYDHQGQGIQSDSDFFKKIKAIDTTSQELEVTEGLTNRNPALTIDQYLDAVIEPTKGHAKIVAKRMAAHILTGWESLVGTKVAKRFSALAALDTLYDDEIYHLIKDPQRLAEFLTQQEGLVPNESSREREKIEQGLTTIATTLYKVYPYREHIIKAAFKLAAVGSPTIGGEEEANKQLQGLIDAPEATDKLKKAFPNKQQAVKRIAAKKELAKLISDTLILNRRSLSDTIFFIRQALRDRDIDYRTLLGLLSTNVTGGFAERYREKRREINADTLIKKYLKVAGRDKIPDKEMQLLTRLSKTVIGTDVSESLAAVSDSISAILKCQMLEARIRRDFQNLLNQGVNEDTLNGALAAFKASKEKIFESYRPSEMDRFAHELSSLVRDTESQIHQDVRLTELTKITREVYKGEMSHLAPAVISFLTQGAGGNLPSEEEFKRRLRALTALDPTLQAKVVLGEHSLQYAQRIQKEGQKPPQKVEKIIPETPRTATKPEMPAPVSPKRVTVSDIKSASEIQRAAANERVRQQNQRLVRNGENYYQQLTSTDLQGAEISAESRGTLQRVFNKLGQILFGHPDAARAMKELEELRAKEVQRVQEKIQKEQEEMNRNSRTGR